MKLDKTLDEKLKIYWQTLILILLISCSKNEKGGPDGGAVEPPEREVTDIVCPVHQVPVFKVHASYATVRYAWDPKLGLTVEQIRNRFPYAIWDSNLHRVDAEGGITDVIFGSFVAEHTLRKRRSPCHDNPCHPPRNAANKPVMDKRDPVAS